MTRPPNQAIRNEIRQNLLTNYEIAHELGISASTLYYRLQRPLTSDQEKTIRTAIKKLADAQQTEA